MKAILERCRQMFNKIQHTTCIFLNTFWRNCCRWTWVAFKWVNCQIIKILFSAFPAFWVANAKQSVVVIVTQKRGRVTFFFLQVTNCQQTGKVSKWIHLQRFDKLQSWCFNKGVLHLRPCVILGSLDYCYVWAVMKCKSSLLYSHFTQF